MRVHTNTEVFLIVFSLVFFFIGVCNGFYCCQRFLTDTQKWDLTCSSLGCPAPFPNVGFFHGFYQTNDCSTCSLTDSGKNSSYCCHHYYSALRKWDNDLSENGCPIDEECIDTGGMCLFAGFTSMDQGGICLTPVTLEKPSLEKFMEINEIAQSVEGNINQHEKISEKMVERKEKNNADIGSFCCEYENVDSQRYYHCNGNAECPAVLNSTVCLGSQCFLTGFSVTNSSSTCSACVAPACNTMNGDCTSCASIGTCGYCFADSTCRQITDQTCADPANRLTFNFENCAAGPCFYNEYCEYCARKKECGWCQTDIAGGGTCLYQNPGRTAPLYGTCASNKWLGDYNKCPRSEVSPPDMTPAQRAGIALGVMAAVVMVVGIVIGVILYSRKKRAQQNGFSSSQPTRTLSNEQNESSPFFASR